MKNKLQKIITLLMIAFFSGTAFSGVDEGKEAFSAGNYNKAANEFRVSAKQGNSEAQLLLGVMYTLDLWQKNDKEAARWIKKAAEQGEPEAQYMLAILYGRGTGIRQDSKEAFKWYKKAAEQGNVKAQLMLGRWYTSIITPKDYNKSVFWLKKASEQGDKEAQYDLGIKYISGNGVAKNYKVAAMWLNKSASQGYIDSQLLLGIFYEDGIGVPKNNTMAKKWFKKAAGQEKNMGEKLFSLAMTFSMDMFEKNYFIMTKLFKKSAEFGYAADYNVGLSYNAGSGVRQNKIEAKRWFGKSCDSGDQRGCEQYRILNEQGIN